MPIAINLICLALRIVRIVFMQHWRSLTVLALVIAGISMWCAS
jgi:hypothetical protein